MSGQGEAVTESALSVLARGVGVEKEALALLRQEDAPPAFVARLMDAELLSDAVRVVGAVLPAREGIWWAWSCSKKAVGPEAGEEMVAILAAVERWLREPTDPNRRTAMDVAEAADYATPAGCVALAAFFSGGSIAPTHVQAVPPPVHASAKAVATAILISAVFSEPEKAPEKLKESLEQGIHVARRVGLWTA